VWVVFALGMTPFSGGWSSREDQGVGLREGYGFFTEGLSQT